MRQNVTRDVNSNLLLTKLIIKLIALPLSIHDIDPQTGFYTYMYVYIYKKH